MHSSYPKATALLVQPAKKSGLEKSMATDIKTLVTIFLGIWTFVIVCIVIGMYATWEANMIDNADNGRGNQETTEALGNFHFLGPFGTLLK